MAFRTPLRRLLPLLVAALLLTIPVAGAEGKVRKCNGQRVLCELPFNEVVLAGSHNAMSAASLGWSLPNQSISIPKQLEYGVRALLIDTHYGRLREDGVVVTDDDGEVPASVGPRSTYLCHVYCELGATRLEPGLRKIRKFLRNHPKNVLLIENEDYISPEDFAAAVEGSQLSDFIYEGPTDTWPTMRKMIRTEQQVVFLADNNGGTIPWYHETYAGILQETPYTFESPDELTSPPNWRKSCGPNRGDVTGSMFLMNHWSPPTAPAVPDLAASAEVNARPVIYNRAVTCSQVRGRLPSIIAVDQVTAGGLLDAVRDLNALAASTPGLGA